MREFGDFNRWFEQQGKAEELMNEVKEKLSSNGFEQTEAGDWTKEDKKKRTVKEIHDVVQNDLAKAGLTLKFDTSTPKDFQVESYTHKKWTVKNLMDSVSIYDLLHKNELERAIDALGLLENSQLDRLAMAVADELIKRREQSFQAYAQEQANNYVADQEYEDYEGFIRIGSDHE